MIFDDFPANPIKGITDFFGRFEFTDLPYGNYRYSIYHEDYQGDPGFLMLDGLENELTIILREK